MIKDFHSEGLITKDDYEGALGAYKAYINEVRSEEQDEAVMISERYCYYESETKEIDKRLHSKHPLREMIALSVFRSCPSMSHHTSLAVASLCVTGVGGWVCFTVGKGRHISSYEPTEHLCAFCRTPGK